MIQKYPGFRIPANIPDISDIPDLATFGHSKWSATASYGIPEGKSGTHTFTCANFSNPI